MKKTILSMATAFIFGAFMLTSCGGGEAQEPEENNETAQEQEEEMNEPEVNQVELDARRMAELACESIANRTAGQEAGLTQEEINEQNASLNAEMTEISLRFEAEYANTDKQAEFQRIYEEGLQACM